MPGPVLDPNSPQGKAYVQQHSPNAHVLALRQFLIHQGYHIPATGGHVGTLMKSALADWHKGVGKRNPIKWSAHQNAQHDTFRYTKGGADLATPPAKHPTMKNDPSLNHPGGIDVPKHGVAGTHPHPTHGVAPNSPHGHPHGGRGGGGGAQGFMGMLSNLVGNSATAKQIPLSLADDIAGPDTAAAKAVQSEIDQLPSAKKAALKNILGWYDQVQSSEKTASQRDQKIANQGAEAMSSNTKGIMDSLGGDAMAGAGSIGAVGANDSNTLKALGANDAMLASDLAPIFDLVSADASKQTQHQFDEGKVQLTNALAAAHGQESADRAAAIMQILGANNASRQTNFANKSGLLNTLASLQISGINAAGEAQSRALNNALKMAELKKAGAKGDALSAMSPAQRADFVQKIVSGLVDPNTHKLSMSWPDALRSARNTVRSAGLNPKSRQVINTIIGPALSNAGITAQGGGYWPAIYQP